MPNTTPGPDQTTRARAEGPLSAPAPWRPVALAALTAVLLALCVALAVPFLPAVAWAVALAIVAWPLHARISRRVPRAGLAAAISTLLVVVAVLVPGLFVTYHLVREAGSAAERMNGDRSEGTVREKVAQAPGMAGAVEWMDRVGLDVDREARNVIAAHTQDASGLVQGSIRATVQTVVALFVLFHLFRDRRSLAEQVRRLLPLTRVEADRVFEGFADSVHANLYATLVTSVIDGVGGGLMFWATGLPSPVLWGVVMFVLSVLPIVGTFVVWMPAAVYLGMSGNWPGAAAMVGWGVAFWVVVDNFIYVRVAGGRMRLHQVPTLLAFLGGLALFGASGMVLGPAILAVTVAVLEVWHRRAAATPVDPAPPPPRDSANGQAGPGSDWAVAPGAVG